MSDGTWNPVVSTAWISSPATNIPPPIALNDANLDPCWRKQIIAAGLRRVVPSGPPAPALAAAVPVPVRGC